VSPTRAAVLSYAGYLDERERVFMAEPDELEPEAR
jgi:hypothetical protein